MKKRKVSFFVSYAQANKSLASNFLEKYEEQISPSKFYNYNLWRDTGILVGENWHNEIQSALAECDLGILLISPRFLSSAYIKESELPTFIGSRPKPVIPVMLQPISLDRHDLKGIQEHQIFRLDADRFKHPRAYAECKTNRKDDFVRELFRQVEFRLDKILSKEKA